LTTDEVSDEERMVVSLVLPKSEGNWEGNCWLSAASTQNDTRTRIP